MILSELMTQVRGLSYSKKDSSDEYEEGKIAVLRAGNIYDSQIIEKDYVFVPKSLVKEKQYLRRGDVLIAASSGSISVVGKAAMVSKNMNASFGAFCKVLRPDISKVDLHYFKHFFETDYYKRTIKSLAEGANINNLKTEHFDNLYIPLPPLEEQKNIAAILDAADDYRQKTKALIDKYDQLTQSLFLDMFGDPVTNPKGWETVSLSKICDFSKRTVKPEEIKKGDIYIALECIEKTTGKINEKFVVEAGELKSNKFLFNENHILYGKLRPYLNKVAAPDFTGVCSTDIIPLKPVEGKTVKAYIISMLRGSWFVSYADERSSGANLPRISPNEVQKYLTILPPLSLQNQFAERVDQIEKQKQQAELSLVKAEELFNSLLQKAFKGELTN